MGILPFRWRNPGSLKTPPRPVAKWSPAYAACSMQLTLSRLPPFFSFFFFFFSSVRQRSTTSNNKFRIADPLLSLSFRPLLMPLPTYFSYHCCAIYYPESCHGSKDVYDAQRLQTFSNHAPGVEPLAVTLRMTTRKWLIHRLIPVA